MINLKWMRYVYLSVTVIVCLIGTCFINIHPIIVFLLSLLKDTYKIICKNRN